MKTGVGMCSRLGVLLCVGLLLGGCSDSGSDTGNKNASNSMQHLTADLRATTSNSVVLSFTCSLDYTIDIGGSSAQTEAWVRDYLDSSANSVVFANPYQGLDDSRLSELVTEKMKKGVVGLPGVNGTPSFDATCGDIKPAD